MNRKIPSNVRDFFVTTPWVINDANKNKAATASFSLEIHSIQTPDERKAHYDKLVQFCHQFGIIPNIESSENGITINCIELERHMPNWRRDVDKFRVKKSQSRLFEDTNRRAKEGYYWTPISGLNHHGEPLSRMECPSEVDADALTLNLQAAHIPVVRQDAKGSTQYLYVPAKKLREIGIYDNSVTSEEMERGLLADDPFIEARRQFFAQPWKRLTDAPQYHELVVPDIKREEIDNILKTLDIAASDIVYRNGYTFYYVAEDVMVHAHDHYPPSPDSAPTGRDITPPNEERHRK